MVERFEKFSYAIYEISRCWHKIAHDELKKYGIKGSYATYFTAMYRHENGITAARLSEVCGRDKADVSRALSLLENKGFVIRKENGRNHYRAKVFLTNAGNELAAYIIRRIHVALDIGGNGLNIAQRDTFYQCLELIAANMRDISENGLPENSPYESSQQ